MASPLFLGIDVGTGSARAAVFDAAGRRHGHGFAYIEIWQEPGSIVEQSSDNIWRQVCRAARAALRQAQARPADVAGCGFDATCSLVALDSHGRPVSLSLSGDDMRNIVVWMDHRACDDALAINATAHPVLRAVGGVISPEMQTPKLRWIKQHLPTAYRRAAHFFDLPDYLTWRASGSFSRSACSTVCKWTFRGGSSAAGWDPTYFHQIGLDDMVADHFQRIGQDIRPPGSLAGPLSSSAARELGLRPGTAVGTSMIDAHAGALGLLGMDLAQDDRPSPPLESRLALIGGTSSCHLAVSAEPRFVPGVWGPYPEALLPGLSLAEGGQSATGALIDHIIHNHAAAPALARDAKRSGHTVYDLLNTELLQLTGPDSPIDRLSANLHVCPDFHGNRSPLADPSLRGMISGLTLDASRPALARLYLATLQAIAYGTRHILSALESAGWHFQAVIACGGGTKNPVFLAQHANALARPLILPEEPEAVLLGAAMLGAAASGHFPDLPAAMRAMSRPGRRIDPDPSTVPYHDARFTTFLRMPQDQKAYRQET